MKKIISYILTAIIALLVLPQIVMAETGFTIGTILDTAETANETIDVTATFNVGEANGTVEPIIVDSIGQVITLPDDTGLTYDGYWLKGWQVDGGDDTIYRPGEAFTVTSVPIKFNAVWSKIYNVLDIADWSLTANETFDDGTTTHQNWLTPSKTVYNSYFVINNMLNLGYNQNVLTTNIAFDDVIMEFDYRPYFRITSSNRMVFTICGTSFHMIGMEKAIQTAQGVTSGQSVKRETAYTFKHENWYKFRIERVGTEFKLYVKELEDEYYTLIYKGTTPEGANPIKINVYDTSDWTGKKDNSAGGKNGYMDNLKIYQPKSVDIDPEYNPITLNVSSMRKITPQGLRIAGFVTNAIKAAADEYGFVVARADQYTDATQVVNGAANTITAATYVKGEKDSYYVDASEDATAANTAFGEHALDENGWYFTGVYVNVPMNATALQTKLICRTYVKIGDTYFYGEPVAKSVYEVAEALCNKYGEEVPDFAKQVYDIVNHVAE